MSLELKNFLVLEDPRVKNNIMDLVDKLVRESTNEIKASSGDTTKDLIMGKHDEKIEEDYQTVAMYITTLLVADERTGVLKTDYKELAETLTKNEKTIRKYTERFINSAFERRMIKK